MVLSYFRGNPFLRAVARQKFLPPNPLVLNRFSRRVSACENRSAAPAASRCFVHWTRFAAAAPGDKIFQRTAHSPAARTLSATKVAVTKISVARHSVLVNLDGGPSSASPVSATGSGSASLSCMCPVHPHMSAGRDFFDSLKALCVYYSMILEKWWVLQ